MSIWEWIKIKGSAIFQSNRSADVIDFGAGFGLISASVYADINNGIHLLMGLGGCSAIDVISILKKQRQEIVDYKMNISGERETGKEPSLWKSVNIEFHLYGDIDPDKAARAVDLSVNKYCSVAATLMGSGTKITSQVFVHPAQ